MLVAGALILGCSSNNGAASNGTGGNATGGIVASSQSAAASGGIQQTGGNPPSGGTASAAGASGGGGAAGSGAGVPGQGGTFATGGTTSSGGSRQGGTTASGSSGLGGSTVGSGGSVSSGGVSSSGGNSNSGGVVTAGGSRTTGGAGGTGGSSATGGSAGVSTCGAAAGSGPVGTLTDPGPGSTGDVSPPNPPGITFKDTDGDLVNAHGGGIIRVCDTFYLHGEYFLSTTTDNDFNGFSMYSSRDLATWKKEGNKGIILPQQSSGQLGPNRKGERPHIIKCPATGEFVLYAHSADVTYQADKEVVYATSPTVNGVYKFVGSLLSTSGQIAAHSDMSAYADETGAYVVTESGHVFTLSSDCHSWVSDKQFSALNGTTGGIEAPTVFHANGTYYFVGSDKTGWRANDDFYSTATSMNGPWTYKGYIAPEGKKTWMTQSTWVQPIVGSQGTVFMYWGDHWYGDQDTSNPGVHNYLTTYVFQPLIFTNGTTLLPTYLASWKIDIGAGTWSQ